jgi:hypothetical protein
VKNKNKGSSEPPTVCFVAGLPWRLPTGLVQGAGDELQEEEAKHAKLKDQEKTERVVLASTMMQRAQKMCQCLWPAASVSDRRPREVSGALSRLLSPLCTAATKAGEDEIPAPDVAGLRTVMMWPACAL